MNTIHLPTPAESPFPAESLSTCAIEPLLVPATVAGPMCGRAVASWWRDCAAGRCPAPLKVGGRTLWRVADLRMWVALGCPSRDEFEARKEAAERRPAR
jgi:prophage regulatory protein